MSPRKDRPANSTPGKRKPSSKSTSDNSQDNASLQRINKVLAAAGLGSRRQVDELIEQGRVEINGQVVTQVGVKVDLSNASIVVDGELLKQHRPVYYALHKPEGVLCTNRDPQGRPRVIDFVPNQHRLFPVGRLDASSTGLILLTNDGELAQQLAHPKHEISKRYAVVVVGQIELDALKRLERGIYLAEGKAQVDHVKIKKARKTSTEIEITLSEGKNREIRRVLARLGHKVVSLKRIAIGPLKLADLPEGAYRALSTNEVQGLYQAVDDVRRERKAARKARKKLAAAADQAHAQSDGVSENNSGKSASAKKAPKGQGKKWDKLPSLAQNPYATEDDLEDATPTDQNEELILIRDHGPVGSSRDDDEEYFFTPRQRAGSVIGQEDDQELLKSNKDRIEFELIDSDDEDYDEDYDDDYGDDYEEDYEEDEEELHPKKQGGKPRRPGSPSSNSRGARRSPPGRDESTEGGSKRSGPKRGGPSSGRPKRSGPNRGGPSSGRPGSGRPMRGVSSRSGSSSGGPNDGRPSSGRPKRGGPKSSGPKRGGPKSGGPKSGGPKSGGPKSGGPKSGGPKRGGPKRGGRSGRGTSR